MENTLEGTTVVVQEEKTKVELTVTGVLADLKEGLDRKAIGAKYGLKGFEVAALFQHPKLKNKKGIKPQVLGFVLIDDAPEVTAKNKVHDKGPLDSEDVQADVQPESAIGVTNGAFN